ncbi:MAG: hypothetical protein IKA17_09890 [Clostridia bacterium]|nr:hypothetical protein [Clostridia bacterium]
MRNDIFLGPLPDIFKMNNGNRVKTVSDWKKRREEIIEAAVSLEFGGMPPEPDSVVVEKLTEPMRGRINSYRVHCYIDGKDFNFCVKIYPPKKDGKFPLLICGDSIYRHCNDRVIDEANERGFAVAKFNRTEFAPDMYNSNRENGIYPFYPNLSFSAISAWAWGYMRAVDAVTTLDYIDIDNIAISGHSRGGKTVLLAGALDERIRFVNPNGSGTHGCGCYRFEQREEAGLYEDNRSEKLADLFRAVPYWMGQEMKKYIGKENEIPHDMHFIKALVAPRILLETNGYADIWSNPRGSYITNLEAKKVWDFLGKPQYCLTHYRDGGHSQTFEDFCVLFDVMEQVISGKEPIAYPKPYDDIYFDIND